MTHDDATEPGAPPAAPPDEPHAPTPGTREEVDAIRRRVVNVIGHELRTPITTLHGLANSLLSADADSVRREIAPALIRNARRLERLLDDMLIASDVTTALPVQDPRPIPVEEAVRDVWSETVETHPGVSEDDLTLTGEAVALVAGVALRGILERILDNAARYGRPPFAVRIVRGGNLVELSLEVPGPEMHPEEVALAVEPFFRGEHAVTSTAGLGLGLPVARALAEQGGGGLDVQARDGGGLVTRVTLPAAQ